MAKNTHGFFTFTAMASLFGAHEFVAIIADISRNRCLFLVRDILVR